MKVKELLQNPDSWTQGSSAKDSEGSVVGLYSSSAIRWCLGGAIALCYVKEYDKIYEMLTKELGQTPIYWNDAPERTHQEVLSLVTRLDI